MQFNQLYNLILESIITEDINSKIKKAINILIKSGQLKDQNDPRAEQVKEIIKRNANIDINGKTKLDQLLKANQKYTNRAESIDLDSIPEFSQKKQYPNGVVIYQVEDSSKGMRAVRKIIDLQWGQDANPWCLAARTGKKGDLRTASRHWKYYSAYPKRIAFQNGKLIAFCANGGNNVETTLNMWWDREDKPHYQLPLLDGTQMKIDQFFHLDMLEKFPHLKLNKETGRYDYDDLLYLNNGYIIDGHFPIPLGVIDGEFNCNDCIMLQTLENAPTEVKGQFNCGHNKNLKSLKGMPQKVGRGIFVAGNDKLENLEGMPRVCNGTLQAYSCKNLKSLKGAPEIVRGTCYFSGNDQLIDLQGCPQEIGGKLDLAGCTNLKSLKGIARKIGKGIMLYHCDNLQSLEGIPSNFHGQLCINECPKLKLTQEDKKKYQFVDDIL